LLQQQSHPWPVVETELVFGSHLHGEQEQSQLQGEHEQLAPHFPLLAGSSGQTLANCPNWIPSAGENRKCPLGPCHTHSKRS
jgi:hypothetical protein